MKVCTRNGMKAAQTMRSLLKSTLCEPMNSFTGTGNNSVKNGEKGELYDTLLAEATGSISLTRLNMFIASHVQAMVSPEIDKTCVDRMVTLEYDDEEGETKTLKYVVGGEDEPQLYIQQGVRVIFYETPLGAALVGKRVGDDLTIKLGGKSYDATIVAIEHTPEPDHEVHAEDAQRQLPLKVAAA